MSSLIRREYFYYLEKYSKNPPEHCTFTDCYFCVYHLHGFPKLNYSTCCKLGFPCSCTKIDFLKKLLEVI